MLFHIIIFTPKVGKELVARAREMHKEVDNILTTSQKTLHKIKVSGLAKLQQQEKHLEDTINRMKQDVERYENQLRDADPNAFLEFEQDPGQNKDKTKSPTLETPPSPIFTKKQMDANAMQDIFGQLSAQVIPQNSAETQQNSGQVSKMSKKNSEKPVSPQLAIGKTAIPPPGEQAASSVTLIPYASVQSRFTTSNPDPHITCVGQGLAWVKTGLTLGIWSKLQLVDRSGTVRDTIRTNFNIYDVAVTSDGDLLLADNRGHCIKSVSRERETSTLFRTGGHPDGLCCLHNNDIVVACGNTREVIVYSRIGRMKQTLDHIKFSYPIDVNVNKVNQDIYVCDKAGSLLDFSGKVIAVGADYQLRYEYTGQGDNSFSPTEVCTDHLGYVLITDHKNHQIHILDQEGHFIQYVLTSQQGLASPFTIDVDNEGYMWVGEWINLFNGCVKVVRYFDAVEMKGRK